MKELIRIFILFMILSYFAMAFVLLDVNFCHWGMEYRAAFIFMGVFISLIGTAIVWLVRNEKKI